MLGYVTQMEANPKMEETSRWKRRINFVELSSHKSRFDY